MAIIRNLNVKHENFLIVQYMDSLWLHGHKVLYVQKDLLQDSVFIETFHIFHYCSQFHIGKIASCSLFRDL